MTLQACARVITNVHRCTTVSFPMLPARQSLRPPPLLQPAFRKRLSRERRLEISLVHHVNLDALARGDADFTILFDLAGAVLTWRHVADRLRRGQAEMEQQFELVERLLLRFDDTGKVRFEADDYQIAKEGVVVMDLLADEVDMATAQWAAERSQAAMERWFDRNLSGR